MTEPHIGIPIFGLPDYSTQLDRMEQLMATAAEQISALDAKVTALGTVVTDIKGDFDALLEAMNAERENLTEAGQAALDLANENVDARAAQLADLDTAVGEHDGLPA
jgi:hypothetical protein